MVIDITKPVVDERINKEILVNDKVSSSIVMYLVEPYEKALLYINGQFSDLLGPGSYYFWKSNVNVQMMKVDMRQLQLDMVGQEIMTKDKVTIRVNFVTQYKILDPMLAMLKIQDYRNQLYIMLQLILREYIGTMTLDELLSVKEEIGSFVVASLKEKANGWGLEFIYAGVKDVILPGEIRAILNRVIEAEKQAQANIIMRREETASARSLLNTAKLMDDNPTLYRLKELEYIEKITEKVQTLSIGGENQILHQLKQLFGS